MIFIPARRATVLVPTPTPDRLDLRHLFILLTDPLGEQKENLIVSLSSVRVGRYHDPTCLLYPGDHEFVTSDSYVKYSTCRMESADKLIRGVKSGVLSPRNTLDGAIFARVCRGVTESRHTPFEIKALYKSVTEVDTPGECDDE